MNDTPEVLTFELDADTSGLQASLREADQLGRQFSRTLTSAFDDIAVRGQKLDDVIKSVALKLSQVAFRAAFKPFEDSISSGIGSFVSGLAGFSAGGSPVRQLPVPFAAAGVAAAPATFSFGRGAFEGPGSSNVDVALPSGHSAGSRTGLRGRGGELMPHVTFNVTATDAQSFQRSEAQIGAMFSRVLARGERNL